MNRLSVFHLVTMRYTLLIIPSVLQYVTSVTSAPVAAPLGPGYSPPTDFTSNNSLIPAAWSNFGATIESYIQANQSVEGLVPNLGSYTFSVGAFSVYDACAAQALQYHTTGSDVKTSNIGATKADGDSIYRIASISKAFTVYLTLLEIGSGYWDSPVTDFVSELADFASKAPKDPINFVDWKQVTLGALAGQIAGLPRDTPIDGSDMAIVGTDSTSLGLPPLNDTIAAIDPCITSANASGIHCSDNTHLQAVYERAPVYLPWSTPIYSDLAYNILSYAVENITGKSFGDMMEKDIFKPLGMNTTYYTIVPTLNNAIIPGGKATTAATAFSSIDEPSIASGGISSTINDLAKFGISILNSTLLCPEETRKWLKPISHTGSLYESVGRPWEILRITQPVTGRVNDLYTKVGGATGYSSFLILSPDHGAGFSILVAGNASTDLANTVIADALSSTVIPALEAQAAAEAARNFAGKYISASPTLNSSLTLAVTPSSGSGLLVTSWISNSTDMFSWLTKSAGDELALFPTDLRTAAFDQAGKVAYRGTFGSSTFPSGLGPFTDQQTVDGTWVLVDSKIYGGVILDLFVFDVDAQGRAVSVSPVATRATLRKVE